MLDNFYKSDGVSSAGNPTIEMRIVLLLSCFILLASASDKPELKDVKLIRANLLDDAKKDEFCKIFTAYRNWNKTALYYDSSVTAMLLSAARNTELFKKVLRQYFACEDIVLEGQSALKFLEKAFEELLPLKQIISAKIIYGHAKKDDECNENILKDMSQNIDNLIAGRSDHMESVGMGKVKDLAGQVRTKINFLQRGEGTKDSEEICKSVKRKIVQLLSNPK